MKNRHHQEILTLIRKRSGTPTQHTFLNSYLGNSHPRYPVNAPALRDIAKTWMRGHKDLTASQFEDLLTSLIEGESSTEKVTAGILMDYATREQLAINPKAFDGWLQHLEGWAEVDAVCTNKYTVKQLPLDWKKWEPMLTRFSKDKDIHKRRASLVLLCSPLRKIEDERLVVAALKNVSKLKAEKHVLITKAISWILRSAVKYHKKAIAEFVKKNKETLPPIAVRETMMVLRTGKKTKD